MNKQLKELLIKKRVVQKSLDKIQSAVDGVRKNTKFRCAKCEFKNSLALGGIYKINWRGIVAEYQFFCHKCHCVNRILSKSTTNYRGFMDTLSKDYLKFYTMIDIHFDENEPAKKHKFVNNFYIEDLIDEERVFENE